MKKIKRFRAKDGSYFWLFFPGLAFLKTTVSKSISCLKETRAPKLQVSGE